MTLLLLKSTLLQQSNNWSHLTIAPQTRPTHSLKTSHVRTAMSLVILSVGLVYTLNMDILFDWHYTITHCLYLKFCKTLCMYNSLQNHYPYPFVSHPSIRDVMSNSSAYRRIRCITSLGCLETVNSTSSNLTDAFSQSTYSLENPPGATSRLSAQCC